jgi:DNA polymerase/3'-5' exonuclease PolX
MRVQLPSEDLFPIELLEYRVQTSILEHFGGRHPSISEIADIHDDDLLKLPGVGPSTIRKIRLLTRGEIKSLSAMTRFSDAELLQEHERQLTRLSEFRNEFKRREHEFKRQLRAVRLELRVRGLSPK